MKRVVLVVAALVAASLRLSAQEAVASKTAGGSPVAPAAATNAAVRIHAAEAKAHLKANAVVTGKVAEVNVAERLVRLNFDNPYPNQVFTAIVFAAKTNLFPQIEKLKDKTVEVTGQIADYRGRPEIILTNAAQLRVVDAPPAAPANPAK